MWTKQNIKASVSREVVYLLAFSVIGYIAYHCYFDACGIQAYALEEQKISKLRYRLSQFTSERIALEKKAALLREGSINKEVLDEYSRKNLNLANKDDLIILNY